VHEQLDLSQLNQEAFYRYKMRDALMCGTTEGLEERLEKWFKQIYGYRKPEIPEDWEIRASNPRAMFGAIDEATHLLRNEAFMKEFQEYRECLEDEDMYYCREVLERASRILDELVKEEGVPTSNSGFFGLR